MRASIHPPECPTAWEKHIVCNQAIGTGYKPAPAGNMRLPMGLAVSLMLFA
jgi:hypothetical protein